MSGSDEARPLAGERFMQDWREDTLHTLFVRIRNLMPFDEPATLSEDAYLDSVAYILEFNGFPPGDRELVPDGLADIRIEGREGPAEVPSFALVQVVGCLTEDAGGWLLMNSTRAVRTRDPSASTDDELSALGSRRLGTRAFELMNVYPNPASHAGHRMAVKGFLIRDPGRRPHQRQLARHRRRRLRAVGGKPAASSPPRGDAECAGRPARRSYCPAGFTTATLFTSRSCFEAS